MIIGIGIDLCEIARVAESINNSSFLRRYFSEEERAYIQSRGMGSAASAAGCFAAKEAFLKAIGTGLNGVPLLDISITHDVLGAPRYCLAGAAEEWYRKHGGTRLHLSLTHDGGIAAAVAIIEGELPDA
jgi:holo-[acyl-carrier protein] synthase